MADYKTASSELEQARADEMEQTGDGITKIDSIRSGHASKPHEDGIYAEALAQYPTDDSIDPILEKRVRRKLDRLIIPVLGVCYFFYYVDKTTLYVLSYRKSNKTQTSDHSSLVPMPLFSASKKISI
jgi:hypothetical protein